MSCKRLFSLLLLAFGLLGSIDQAVAQNSEEPVAEANHESGDDKKSINFTELIFGHVGDSHEWHFFDMGKKPVAIPLPVIIYQPGKGLDIFSAAAFGEMEHEGNKLVSHSYHGYHLEMEMKEKVVADDGTPLYDFSLTKNSVSMLLSVVLVLLIMLNVAKRYKQAGSGTAPKGLQNAVESAILFIRDEVARPNLGHKAERFMPLLLTLFFFIWINNLLGLLPGGANFTGNIAVTLCLATISFVVILIRANKHFWSHLLNPPGVPFGVKILLVLIEIISLFIKPVALTIRLFANILAGHIVIMSVISLVFIFAALNVFVGALFVPVSIAFSVFMFMLELLVAVIQAFIFTNLTAVFIGSAVEEAHHHGDGFDHHVSEKEIIA